ncbi:AraC family transcriptional regulator [Pullulanibacillus camelliae]|uniref:AraC family transcriptional regulator n=1 Tax=Pullulanibacillus camelliae TaxID=1707096 RepID=A0A8J3DY61_9BACL|nr:AraC family transcriptional regulator [Pullulanibacillus camelliae]GGE49295.1 AraC family transcriptional regulator [Pullulanibacillus camelliae]
MITSFLKNDQTIGVDYHQKTIGHAGYESDFHSHLEFEIYFFHSGTCNYFINDRIYQLVPGDMIVMHGLTLHRPHPDLNIPYERTKIHFKPDLLENLIHEFSGVDLYLPFRKLQNMRINLQHRRDQLERLFKEIYISYRKKAQPLYMAKLQIHLLELLTLIYQSCEEKLLEQSYEKNSNIKVENVQKIMDFIEAHYQEETLTLDDIAHQTYLSKFYVSRIFKEVTGAGLSDYITTKKVNKAKQLLLSGKTVTEASLEVGYKHPAYFSRIFKQKVGVTADHFRKMTE